MGGKEFTWGSQAKILLIGDCFANEKLEKMRSFKPPVAEAFRVEGDNHDGIKIERPEFASLTSTLLQKMCSMSISSLFRRDRIIQFLFGSAPGNAIIFYPGNFPGTARN